ncbi:hypothetical protein SM0020_19752 [Sinorhizobium meliloti CCNWSX0020]|uniref:Transmembrane protein n=2 Tax=Rhizobium meliloti TaxID=382 RepID=H0G3A4_RHIML|nr:hypothetical protein SM0020_19752 [Sinorhizobium meliloti CCNWSX0020]
MPFPVMPFVVPAFQPLRKPRRADPLASGVASTHMPNRKVTIMQSIRSVLFTAAAITITLVAFVFTASLALALAGIAAIIAVGSAIAAKLNGRPVQARARARANPGKRGTIIDL